MQQEPVATPPRISSEKPRDPRLDVIRGVAILLVLSWHTPVPRAGWLPWKIVEFPGARFGWAGVDLFFVLSGFLIGGLIMAEVNKTGGFALGNFYLRRAYKIGPQLYVYLAYVALFLAPRHPEMAWQVQWPSWVALQNYLGAVEKHLWSLAVEEHFYLLLALALAWLTARRKLTERSVDGLVVGVCAFCLAARCLSVGLLKDPQGVHGWTHTRIDSLMIGVFLAALYRLDGRRGHWEKLVQRRSLLWLALAVGIGCLTFVPEYSATMMTIGYSVVAIGFAAGLTLMQTSSVPTGPILKPYLALAWIGRISYGTYLWQFALSPHLVDFADRLSAKRHLSPAVSWPLLTAAWIGGAVLAGWITWMAIEVPTLHFRNRRMGGESVRP